LVKRRRANESEEEQQLTRKAQESSSSEMVIELPKERFEAFKAAIAAAFKSKRCNDLNYDVLFAEVNKKCDTPFTQSEFEFGISALEKLEIVMKAGELIYLTT